MFQRIVLPFLYYSSGLIDADFVTSDISVNNIQETNLRRRVSDLEDRHERDKAEKDGNYVEDEFTFDAASSSKCAVSDNGSYGLPTPESGTLEVKYYYEMEYAPETESEEELLSAVEKSIGSSVVSVFFKECRGRRLVSKADISTDTNYERIIPDRAKYERTTPITADDNRTTSNNETLEVNDHQISDNHNESLSENTARRPQNNTVSREDRRNDRLSKYANRTKDAISSLVEALDNQPSFIVEGATCQSAGVDGANPCVVIESITYVYYNKGRPTDAVYRLVSASLRVIEFLMDSGFFDYGIHEDIRKLTYVGTRPNYEEPEYEYDYVTDTPVSVDSDDEPVYYAIIASSCLVVLAAIMSVSAIIVTKMKKRGDKKEELYEENDPADHDGSDIENDDNNASGDDLCEDVVGATEHGMSDSSHREKTVSFANDGNANIDNVTDDNDEEPRVATEDRESTNYKSVPPNAENHDESQIIIEMNKCRELSQNVQESSA